MSNCFNKIRRVGDPVDIITGANVDINFEFGLEGPIRFEWRRYYDSSQHLRLRPLGWGHTHEYDRWLLFDIDGMRYIGPEGNPIYFPFLFKDGDKSSSKGFTLYRVSPSCYQVSRYQQPVMEFEFLNPDRPTPLKRLIQDQFSLSFQYNSLNQLERVIDSVGRPIRVEHDDQGRILGLFMVEYTENQEERIIPIITYQYNESGNLIKGVDSYQNSFSFKYDGQNRMISKTDRRGYTFYFEYDREGRCIHTYGEDGLHEVHLKYHPLERTIVLNKGGGGEWTYFINESGHIFQIMDPYQGYKIFNFNEQGQIVEEVDSNGNPAKWLYIEEVPIGKLYPYGKWESINKEVKRGIEHRIANCPSEWEYGELIDRRKIEQPELKLEEMEKPELFTHKRNGLFLSPEGLVYDRFGHLVKEIGPEKTIRRWNYDANGNIQRFIDRDGSQYQFEYSSWNLLKHSIDPLGRRLSFAYNSSEKITSLIDPGGTESEYRYDLKDRLIEIRRHGILKETYGYDLADNLIEKRDSEGHNLLSFEIGPGNLKKARHLASGENHYFEYDSLGRFKEIRTDDHVIQFEYDEWGNRIRDERDGSGVRHQFHGRALASTTIFNHFIIKYHPQSDGSINIEDPGNQLHHIQVMKNGLVRRTMSNGTKEISRFDYEGRCLEKTIERRVDRNVKWKREFQYSGEGDLLFIKDNLMGNFQFEYDPAHRLIKAISPEGTVLAYEYDVADNLIKQPGLDGVRLREGNRIATANGDRFEYNHRNAISLRENHFSKTEYIYDSRDFLKFIEFNGERFWEANYDPLGRRIWKRFGSKKIEYYWDTDRLIAEVRADGSLRIYIYADHFALVPLLFIEYETMDADPTQGRRYFIYCNHIGTPILVEDESGKTVWRGKIEPYGFTHIGESSLIDMPLKFPGHYFDSETGLHYNRFRYYSPELGRYLQSDPAGIENHFNLYLYSTRPTVEVDVRGLGCGGDPPGRPPKGEDGPDSESVTDVRNIPVTTRRGSAPFSDVPSFRNRHIDEIRQILYSLGFRRRQVERRVEALISDDPDIPIYMDRTDSQGGSEIWMRADENGNYEAVRIDPHGHQPPSGATDFKGDPPHCHREYIPNDQARRDSAVHPKTGQNIFEPGTSAEDAANRYAEGWTPGIYGTFSDNNSPTALDDYGSNHTPIGWSSW